MYDEHLRPAGITIGQYSILAALYYVQSMPLLKLAARLELDRTTLTRSVARLDRDGLVSIERGSNDNRVRAISITEAGVRKLVESFPLWMMAKTELQNALGARRLKDFRRTCTSLSMHSRIIAEVLTSPSGMNLRRVADLLTPTDAPKASRDSSTAN